MDVSGVLFRVPQKSQLLYLSINDRDYFCCYLPLLSFLLVCAFIAFCLITSIYFYLPSL